MRWPNVIIRIITLKEEEHMKGLGFWYCIIGVIMVLLVLTGSPLFAAAQKGPSDEMIKGAYRQILTSADKNGDGKLSMAECMSISSNKTKIEKDCKYWDANGDGTITEDEYVSQARRTMR
jgi:hypothetical protein